MTSPRRRHTLFALALLAGGCLEQERHELAPAAAMVDGRRVCLVHRTTLPRTPLVANDVPHETFPPPSVNEAGAGHGTDFPNARTYYWRVLPPPCPPGEPGMEYCPDCQKLYIAFAQRAALASRP